MSRSNREIIAAEMKEKDMRFEVFSDEIYYMFGFQNTHCFGPHSGFGQLLKSKRTKIVKAGENLRKQLRESGVSLNDAIEPVRKLKGDLYKEAHEKIVKRNLKKIAGLKPNMSEKEIEVVMRPTTKGVFYCEETDTLYTCEHNGYTAHEDPSKDEWDIYANERHVGTISRHYNESVSYTPHHGNTSSREGGNLVWVFHFDDSNHHPRAYPNLETFTIDWNDGGWGVSNRSAKYEQIAHEMPHGFVSPNDSVAMFSPAKFKTIGTAFKYYVEMDIVAVRYYQEFVVGGEE